MVGRSRFGGLFSILNHRDIQTIRQAEAHIEIADPDLDDEMFPLAGGKIEDMSINEIIDGLEVYLSYLQIDRGEGLHNTEDDPYLEEVRKENWEYQMNLERGLSSEERAKLGEEKGKSRYWESQLNPILNKLKSRQSDQVDI